MQLRQFLKGQSWWTVTSQTQRVVQFGVKVVTDIGYRSMLNVNMLLLMYLSWEVCKIQHEWALNWCVKIASRLFQMLKMLLSVNVFHNRRVFFARVAALWKHLKRQKYFLKQGVKTLFLRTYSLALSIVYPLDVPLVLSSVDLDEEGNRLYFYTSFRIKNNWCDLFTYYIEKEEKVRVQNTFFCPPAKWLVNVHILPATQ